MSFYTEVIRKSTWFGSTDRVTSTELLEPVTRAAVFEIIADARNVGVPLMVFETYRSRQRQQLLFDRGATQLRDVGVHHYGLACDLVKDINGEPSWKGDFSFLGELARLNGLIWGGDWDEPGPHTFVDAVHVQRIRIHDQPRLFAGTFYPDAAYDTYA